jgi:hypothetical protein
LREVPRRVPLPLPLPLPAVPVFVLIGEVDMARLSGWKKVPCLVLNDPALLDAAM